MSWFLAGFLQLISNPTFLGVIVGSILTLAGVYFTNRANDNRLRLQLHNDRELRNREREMTFRKEVYTGAAEAVTTAINTLSTLSDLNIPQREIGAIFLENAPIVSKVNLIASADTVRALSNLMTELSGAFLRLSGHRVTLCGLQEQITQKNALMKGFAQTRDAMLELMRHHNIEGVKDQRKFEVINGNFEFEAKRIATTTEEVNKLAAELTVKHFAFAKECFAEAMRVNRLVPPVLLAARKELDLSTSLDCYEEILHEAQRKSEAHLNEFLQQISTPQ